MNTKELAAYAERLIESNNNVVFPNYKLVSLCEAYLNLQKEYESVRLIKDVAGEELLAMTELSHKQGKELEAKDVYITQTEINCEGLYEDQRAKIKELKCKLEDSRLISKEGWERLSIAQKDNALLRSALKKIEFYNGPLSIDNDYLDMKKIAQQVLSSTPSDMICLTKEELMGPSEGMIDRIIDAAGGDPDDDAVREIVKAECSITRFLKERADE